MTEPAAIDAQVVDIQNDRLHKGFIKVTLHVAAERGHLLTDVLGWPTYTTPVPVALARLEIGVPHSTPVDGDATVVRKPPDVASASGVSRPSLISFAQDAGIKCNNPNFRLFLETFLPRGNKCDNADEAAEIVRLLCEVDSRSEIIEGTAAADKWERLLWRYASWEAGLE